MKNTSLQSGLALAGITLLLFFIVYFFFSGFNFYIISIKINSFVLPLVYVFASVILLYKKSKTELITLKKGMQYSFSSMFIGGTISFLFIVIFFNFIDKDAQTLLNHQRIESQLKGVYHDYNSINGPEPEDTEKFNNIVKALNSEESRNENLLSFKRSFVFLGFIYSFYLIISLFLSLFFRSRNKTHAIINNNPST